MNSNFPDGARGRSLLIFMSVGMLVILAAPSPVAAQGTDNSQASSSLRTKLIELANNQCSVSNLTTVCGGAWTPTQTFMNSLSRGEVVTVAVTYLYVNSENVALNFSDSLGNALSVVTSQCAVTSPIVCTAIGYFEVTVPGYDDVFVMEHGGSTGEIWYNAGIWQGSSGRQLAAAGASAYCAQGCSPQVGLGPLNVTRAMVVIAASAYAAFYRYTPASWQPGYYYSYSATDFNPKGGDSVFWQGTSFLRGSYQFGATTSPTPLSWAGSAEIVYWSS